MRLKQNNIISAGKEAREVNRFHSASQSGLRSSPLRPDRQRMARLIVTPPHRFSITRVDSLEKVIEKLATTEKTTIAIAREEGGKIRVTSGSWDGEKELCCGLSTGKRSNKYYA
jgi:hypothetical protein